MSGNSSRGLAGTRRRYATVSPHRKPARDRIEPELSRLHSDNDPQGGRKVLLFERFTDRARRVVVLAQEEARLLNHNYIGTEHILLGLIHEGEGVAAKAL